MKRAAGTTCRRGGVTASQCPLNRAAGGPLGCRHDVVRYAIAAGVSLFELARFMGTSVEQIDRTYGHLLPDSIDRARQALDAFVSERTVDEASL
jgi:hypothetical protein